MANRTRWYGKLLGFVAGWLLLRHPAGGILGLLIGHVFDAELWRRKGPDPYAVLGVSERASEDELERAYQRLSAQYQPERVALAAEDIQKQAKIRLKEIQDAFEAIKTLRKDAK